MELILGAVFFGLASYVGILLAGTISATPFEDGPNPTEPPVAWIVIASAVIGAIVAGHAEPRHLIIDSIVICALSAVWCTDARYGLVPDAFTLIPLAIVLGISLIQREPWPAVSAGAAFIPFAGLAVVSRGHGMGWGDVKLAALGGAVLGFETALIAFAVSALAAAVTAYVTGRPKDVIAFAPFLAGAIGIALPLVSS